MPTLDFVQMIQRLQALIVLSEDGPFFVLVNTLCWLMGGLFTIGGLMQLSEIADKQRESYKAPLMSFIGATLMISAPELLSSFTVTAFGDGANASPLAYVREGAEVASFRAVMSLIAFIGYCFFVRGIWILKESGEPQRHRESTTGKALVTMAAGMAAVHSDMVLSIAGQTFGWDMSAYLTR